MPLAVYRKHQPAGTGREWIDAAKHEGYMYDDRDGHKDWVTFWWSGAVTLPMFGRHDIIGCCFNAGTDKGLRVWCNVSLPKNAYEMIYYELLKPAGFKPTKPIQFKTEEIISAEAVNLRAMMPHTPKANWIKEDATKADYQQLNFPVCLLCLEWNEDCYPSRFCRSCDQCNW